MRNLGMAGALCAAVLFAACSTSKNSGAGDDEAVAGAGGADGSGGSNTSPGGEGGSVSEAGFGPTAPGGEANAAGSPGEGGGSNPGGGGMIVALEAALGNSAIALQSADANAFWPEPATDENDEWLITILGAYDGEMDDGAALGHYLVTEPAGASLDFELEAAVSAAPYRAFVGPSWLTIYLKEAGASGFRVDVTCSEVEVNATGTGATVVIVGQDTEDTTNGSLFCVAADGPSPQPFSQPATSFEVEADEDGYAVMPYFEVTAIANTSGQAGTASAKAKVHMEFTALP